MELKPGYKQTEVGVIPEEWEVLAFGELFDVTAGGDVDPKRSTSYRDEIHCYPIYSNALTDRGLYGYCSYADHNAGSITITARGTLGAANFRDHAYTAVGRVLVLQPKHEIVGSYFSEVINHRVKFAIESTGVPQLTAPQISTYRLPVPPLPEQRAIAGALGDVDALLGALEKLIAKKHGLKNAAMQQLLTGQTRLPGFSGEWENASFESVLRKVNSKEYQIQTAEYQTTGIFPIVDQGKDPVVGFSDREDKCFRCPEGGVIVFGDHTCILKFVDFDFVVGADGTQILAAKAGHNARFHAFHLQHRGITTTGYNRHFKFLKERLFVAPPLEEQTAIAEVLSDMDAEIAALEQRLAKTRALKQGMMQELLTGRVRLI
ncbi:MAG: restriction endonuclease subunit S [Deltaproteobacteria bacterium]|nr:restriction endonuclease subunit S [Deltaproteobacteria bacterium]